MPVPVAVFDLDGTLVRRDTLLPFLIGYALRARQVWPLVVLPVFLALHAFRLLSARSAKERLLVTFFRGESKADLARAAAAFSRSWIPSMLRPDVTEQLRAHQAAGHRVVLLSASPDLYVPALANALNIHEVICTQVAVEADVIDGRIVGPNCKGVAKLAALQEYLGTLPEESFAYGDSTTDLPVLTWVRHGFRVCRGKLEPVAMERHRKVRRLPQSRYRGDAACPAHRIQRGCSNMATVELPLRPCVVEVKAAPRRAIGWSGVALLVVLAIAAFFRAHDLGGESFDCDELYAVRLQGLSPRVFGAVLARDSFHNNHPPLMTLPFLFWVAAFGDSEAVVRTLPMVWSVLAVGLAFALGRRLGGTGVGLFSALLMALNPLQIAYAQEARHYALLVTLVAAAHLLFVVCLEDGRSWQRGVYAVVCLLALFTHYYAVIALFPHGLCCLWLLVRGERALRRNAIQTLLALALAVLPFVAWLPVIPYQSAHGQGYLRIGTFPVILDCLREVAGGGTGALGIVFALTATALGLRGLASLRRVPLAPEEGDIQAPLPRWTGLALAGGGLLLASLLYVLAPSLAFPMARQMLADYGYSDEAIQRELNLIHLLLVLFPVMLVPVGGIIYGWNGLTSTGERLGQRLGGEGRPLSRAWVVASWMIVPLVLIRLIGLSGVPFVQSRNFLILSVPICLGMALGLQALCRRRAGVAVALAGMVVVLLGYASFDPLARPLGGSGEALGMHSAPWRELRTALRERGAVDLPLATFKAPASDPILFYLADCRPQRLTAGDVVAQPLLPTVHYVHLHGDARSGELLDALRGVAKHVQPVLTVGTLEVFRVEGRAGSAP
ncbi:MAG: HAD-IB family hydrolase [Gemmataceae bacterium]|nr:HAD-IB family hydrolase [Gemmataceae bacterium]